MNPLLKFDYLIDLRCCFLLPNIYIVKIPLNKYGLVVGASWLFLDMWVNVWRVKGPRI